MARDLPLRKARTGATEPASEAREADHDRDQADRRPLIVAATASGGAAVLDAPAALPVEAESAPARTIHPVDERSAAPRRWPGLPTQITVEGLSYLLIGFLALLSRFYNLGQQAQHHDESLHSYYSWLYYVGSGYGHDPLMHGPFLFHVASISYLLFGDSDASSRYAAALFGAATVLLPWFLRRELGRWGALTASVLLLASPSFLYFGRFHRHDVYSAFLTFLLFIAIVRYVAQPRRAWLVTGAAAWGFLFTNKEDFFIVTAIFGSALVLALLWPAARRVLFLSGGFVVILGFALRVLPKLLRWPQLPEIPWNSPSSAAIQTYITALVSHPLFLTAALLLIGFCAVALQALGRVAGSQSWAEGIFGRFPAGTPMAAARALLLDRRSLGIAAVAAIGVYVTLYTSLFSNPVGIFTGSFGAIFYWLGQHDVRRANQPWFYYLLLLPQYDPLSAILGGAGVVLTGWRLLMHRLFKRAEGPLPFVRGLMAYWAVATVAIYSWAGEKMPWMDIHLVLPLLLITAVMLGTAIERLVEIGRQKLVVVSGATMADAATPRSTAAVGPAATSTLRRPLSPLVVIGLMLICAAAWFLGAARLSGGGDGAAGRGWALLLIPVAALIVLGLAHGARVGWARAGQTVLLAFAGALLLFHVHAGWALAFQTGDVPKDMLVYVQTSPDVTRVMGELDEFSALMTGGKSLPIMFDDNTSWPFQWYLRNYTNRQMITCNASTGCTLVDPPADDVAVVLIGNENLGAHPELTSLLSGYQATAYEMRWHYPEEGYRNFALAPELKPGWSAYMYEGQPHGPADVVASVFSSLTATATPDGQARLFRLLTYRELGAPLGSYAFTVFVKKDLLPQYNQIRYR